MRQRVRRLLYLCQPGFAQQTEIGLHHFNLLGPPEN